MAGTRYVEISLQEMKEFLESLGFRMHKRDPQTEWVANKIFPCDGINYVIRVSTSINTDEKSRNIGADAIRVGVHQGSDGSWVFGSKRVNRTKNWKDAVKNRIEEVETRLVGRQSQYQIAQQV